MRVPGDMAEELEIFFGAASQAACRVYARVDRKLEAPVELVGTLSGPTCLYAQTLPAVFSFVDRGGPTPLAEAVVPEPCFWTPQMPHLYRAELQMRAAGKVLIHAERTFGIRPLAAEDGKLFYAGRSWVLRGVSAGELPATDLAQWHDAETAMYVPNPSDALCEQASRVGVLLVAELAQAELHEARRLQRWPAVGVIAIKASAALDPGALRGNAIVAQRSAGGAPSKAAGWAAAAICELTNADPPPGGFADGQTTLIALRPAGKLASVAAGRAACDRLQRDLARHGQFAGYIV